MSLNNYEIQVTSNGRGKLQVEIKGFKRWFGAQRLFCGNDGVMVAELAWKAAQREIVDYIHDSVIDECETVEDCRQAIANLSIKLNT